MKTTYYKITSNKIVDYFNKNAEDFYTIEYIERDSFDGELVVAEDNESRKQYGPRFNTWEEAIEGLKEFISLRNT